MLLNCNVHRMLMLTYSIPFIAKPLVSFKFSRRKSSTVVCAAKGPRPRFQRVWKTQKKIGTISKSVKLVECIKGLSNVRDEVYGALDAFIAWDLEFPLIVVKKALKALEFEKEWKRIIQVSKWMLSKGQGRTLGSYLALLTAFIEEDRLEEAEELWTKVFNENLERTPRTFFEKMVGVYYNKGMHEKLLEIFADMDELRVYPSVPIVSMVGNVFQELGMIDKYEKLLKKYPPQKWEYRYLKGRRVKVLINRLHQSKVPPIKRLHGSNDADQSAEIAIDVNEFDTDNEGVNQVDVSVNEGVNQVEAELNYSELSVEACVSS